MKMAKIMNKVFQGKVKSLNANPNAKKNNAKPKFIPKIVQKDFPFML